MGSYNYPISFCQNNLQVNVFNNAINKAYFSISTKNIGCLIILQSACSPS